MIDTHKVNIYGWPLDLLAGLLGVLLVFISMWFMPDHIRWANPVIILAESEVKCLDRSPDKPEPNTYYLCSEEFVCWSIKVLSPSTNKVLQIVVTKANLDTLPSLNNYLCELKEHKYDSTWLPHNMASRTQHISRKLYYNYKTARLKDNKATIDALYEIVVLLHGKPAGARFLADVRALRQY